MNTKNDHAPVGFPMVTYNDGVSAQAGASPEFQLLLQAISTCAVPLVHQLIQQNPKIIHDKGLSIIISLLFLHTAISTSHLPLHASVRYDL
jgi:hypothetical protein